VLTEADFPQDWAMTQGNVGTAYLQLPTGDRVENVREAIACFEAALRVRTEADFPYESAETQHSLGEAYLESPSGNKHVPLPQYILSENDRKVWWSLDLPLDTREARSTWARQITSAGTSRVSLARLAAKRGSVVSYIRPSRAGRESVSRYSRSRPTGSARSR